MQSSLVVWGEKISIKSMPKSDVAEIVNSTWAAARPCFKAERERESTTGDKTSVSNYCLSLFLNNRRGTLSAGWQIETSATSLMNNSLKKLITLSSRARFLCCRREQGRDRKGETTNYSSLRLIYCLPFLLCLSQCCRDFALHSQVWCLKHPIFEQ